MRGKTFFYRPNSTGMGAIPARLEQCPWVKVALVACEGWGGRRRQQAWTKPKDDNWVWVLAIKANGFEKESVSKKLNGCKSHRANKPKVSWSKPSYVSHVMVPSEGRLKTEKPKPGNMDGAHRLEWACGKQRLIKSPWRAANQSACKQVGRQAANGDGWIHSN